jgi:hypothetical protein
VCAVWVQNAGATAILLNTNRKTRLRSFARKQDRHACAGALRQNASRPLWPMRSPSAAVPAQPGECTTRVAHCSGVRSAVRWTGSAPPASQGYRRCVAAPNGLKSERKVCVVRIDFSGARDHRTTTRCTKYNGLAVSDVLINVHKHIHDYRRRKSNLSQHTA